jgi:hypothetical protein
VFDLVDENGQSTLNGSGILVASNPAHDAVSNGLLFAFCFLLFHVCCLLFAFTVCFTVKPCPLLVFMLDLQPEFQFFCDLK